MAVAPAILDITRSIVGLGEWLPIALAAALGARLFAQTYSSFGLEEPVTWRLMVVQATQTTWGEGWVAQVALSCAAWITSAAGRFAKPFRLPGALFIAAACAAVTRLTGHSAGHGAALWALHFVHVIGAGLWLGTLGVVWWATPRHERAIVLGLFAPVAGAGVALVVMSGAIMTWRHIQPWPSAWGTTFGLALALKVVAVIGAGLLGALNWRRLHRPAVELRAVAAWLDRLVSAELLLGVLVVVGLTAWLTGLPMPSH
jgi:putative copper resistance protein D